MALTKIATTTLSSTTLTFTLSSIPQTYKDLFILATLRTNGTNVDQRNTGWITFNSDSSSVYGRSRGYGYETSSTGIDQGTDAALIFGSVKNNYTDTYFYSPFEIHIFDYASAYAKPVSVRGGATANASTRYVTNFGFHGYNSTSAISSITFSTDDGSSYMSGSSVTLYGIK